ncbi:hypothetical protein NCCP2145_38830 [Pseudarthrobacter sp. NCCP-2145]|nr:hypothetical protein NCCP2145_38830 [Pseudarthrobacter sp. NCCP-2145]
MDQAITLSTLRLYAQTLSAAALRQSAELSRLHLHQDRQRELDRCGADRLIEKIVDRRLSSQLP